MILLGISINFSACASGGFGLEKAEVDHSLYTNDIPPDASRQDAARISDEATIRNAVSSADIDGLGGNSVPWANADTGASGIISNLRESSKEGQVCRSFVTTRESFDGVRLFKGEACMAEAGAWRLQSFEAV